MITLLRTLDILLASVGLYIVRKLLVNKNRSFTSLPPGPIGLPLIGNVLDMPTSYEHLTFAKWGERWGMVG